MRRSTFIQPNKTTTLNIIGLKNINCSISDNMYILSNYMKNIHPSVSVYTIDINEINKDNIQKLTQDNVKDNIFCIQPFEIKNNIYNVFNIIKNLNNANKKPSAFWVWEFKSLPQIFKYYEKYFQKIYVQSQFCYEVFSNHLTINIEKLLLTSRIHEYIQHIPGHHIQNQSINRIIKETEGKTRIGYCFDVNSSLVRKNPLNLIKAFSILNNNHKYNNKVLILKYRPARNGFFVNRAEEELFNKCITLAKSVTNIYLLNEELNVMDLYKLYTYFDYYISPHCGEGFGITIYDNMILGNKIISPYYSGEKDYLKRDEIIELEYNEKELKCFNAHPIYRQMSSYKGAYISTDSIIDKIDKLVTNPDNFDIMVIDCQPLQHETRGIAKYSFNLLQELINNAHNFKLHIILLVNNFLKKIDSNKIILNRNSQIFTVKFSNVENADAGDRTDLIECNTKAEKEYEKQIAALINNFKPKYFLCLSVFDRMKVMIDIDLLNNNIHTFCILYDLIPFKLNMFHNALERKDCKNYFRQIFNVKKHDKSLAISDFTRNDCSDVVDNIVTIGTGVKVEHFSLTMNDEQNILEKFNIKKKYIFSLTGDGINKGLDILYNNYILLPDYIKKDICLVLSGNISILNNNFTEYEKNKNNVIITGCISEKEVYILNKNAWLFICPSRYEGFGLPPVEAMHHNIPVIVSRRTSLIEIMEREDFMFEINNNSCLELIIKLYNNKQFYNECKEHCFLIKNKYTWSNVVQKFNSVIKNLRRNGEKKELLRQLRFMSTNLKPTNTKKPLV
jgi:glycosyltransferase involved in cell wall biosynthesis